MGAERDYYNTRPRHWLDYMFTKGEGHGKNSVNVSFDGHGFSAVSFLILLLHQQLSHPTQDPARYVNNAENGCGTGIATRACGGGHAFIGPVPLPRR